MAKFKDISIIVGAISAAIGILGLFITVLVVTFGYLAPIRNNTDQIPEIVRGIAYIQGRTDALITKNEGGKLTSLDLRVTVSAESEDVITDAILKYVPVPPEMLPAEHPPEVTVTAHGFVVLPYSLSNVQLPESPFEKALLTIIYTDDDLEIAGGNPQNFVIESWDAELGEWMMLDTIIEGMQLSAIIEEPSWFTLSVREPFQ